MKNYLFIFGLLFIVFSGCKTSPDDSPTYSEVKEPVSVTTTSCDTLHILTDARRARFLKEVISKKQAQDGSNFIVDIHAVENFTVIHNNKPVKGFRINGVDVAFSDKILKKGEEMLGFNSDVTKHQLVPSLDRLFCDKQYIIFMTEYSEVRGSCKQTITVKYPAVVSVVTNSGWDGIPTWVRWMLPLLLLIICLLLFLRLWQNNQDQGDGDYRSKYMERDDINSTSHTSHTTSSSEEYDDLNSCVRGVFNIVGIGGKADFTYKKNNCSVSFKGERKK